MQNLIPKLQTNTCGTVYIDDVQKDNRFVILLLLLLRLLTIVEQKVQNQSKKTPVSSTDYFRYYQLQSNLTGFDYDTGEPNISNE